MSVVRVPVCRTCIASDELCSECSKKLSEGRISNADINVAKAISKLSLKYASLEKAEFEKIHSAGNSLFVMVPKGAAGNLIGHGGIIVNELSNILQKKIRIVEETQNTRELIQKIIYPSRLLGINVVYEGKQEIYKIRISSHDKSRISYKEELENIFSIILNAEAIIIFE